MGIMNATRSAIVGALDAATYAKGGVWAPDRAGVDRRLDIEKPGVVTDARLREIEEHQPQWVKVKGVDVLRSKNSRYVAAPASGRRNASVFSIIDIEKGEEITQLRKGEVNGWLAKRSMEGK
jgi:hypothetical protein